MYLNWMTDKPNLPGWYAWRLNGEIYPYLSRVYVMGGELRIDMKDRSWEHDYALSEISDREWLYVGPLHE